MLANAGKHKNFYSNLNYNRKEVLEIFPCIPR